MLDRAAIDINPKVSRNCNKASAFSAKLRDEHASLISVRKGKGFGLLVFVPKLALSYTPLSEDNEAKPSNEKAGRNTLIEPRWGTATSNKAVFSLFNITL